jgi:lysophospholipase L1-like esterase
VAAQATASGIAVVFSSGNSSAQYSNSAINSYLWNGGAGTAGPTGVVKYLGGIVTNNGTTFYADVDGTTVNGVNSSADIVRFQFSTDSSAPIIRAFSLGGYALRFIINGQYASLTPTTTTKSGWGHIVVNFGSQVVRDVQIEADNQISFGGVDVAKTETVSATTISPQLTLIFAGDSIAQGAGTTYNHYAFASIMCDYMGASNCINVGIGGTGYLVPNTSGTAISRITDVTNQVAANINANPIVIDENGLNDALGSYTPSQIQAACVAFVRAIRTANGPNVPIFETGISANVLGGTSWTGGVNAENAKAACVTQLNDPLVFFLPSITAVGGSIFTGTGTDSFPNGSGNTDIYEHYDGVSNLHPNTLGHAFLAQQWLQEIKRLILPPY